MRIGFDIDGVLANFIPAYQALVVKLAGEDRFQPGDDIDPPCWNWPEFRGYSKEVVGEVWKTIMCRSDFWFNLQPIVPNVETLRMLLPTLSAHDTYYITSRPGLAVKTQTEDWLCGVLRVDQPPTTLIVGHRVKGIVCKALGLDVYIDDNLDNVIDCLRDSPNTRTYLLDRRYNQGDAAYELQVKGEGGCEYTERREAIRVATLGEMFDAERDRL